MKLLRNTGLLAAIVLLFSGLIAIAPASAASVSVTIDGITYQADDENVAAGARITGFSGSGAVTIPDSVEIAGTNYDVVEISNQAFQNKSVTSVVIGNKVKEIGQQAFYNNQITSLTLGSSVQTIKQRAFSDNQIANVTIPDSVTTIGSMAFYKNSLTNVAIGTSVVTIGDNAFEKNLLTTVVIPDSVTTIGDYAFFENFLISVTLGNSVTTIGDAAFRGNLLTTVDFPASVTSIGSTAFTNVSDADPLMLARFHGPAPAVIARSESGRTFDSGTVVEYLAQHGAPTGAFTEPTWQGYESRVANQFDVLFDLNGHGSVAPAPQAVVEGDLVTRPTDPVDPDWVFEGWTTDRAGNDTFDFTTPVTGDLVLYAQWSPAQTGPDPDPDPDPDPSNPDDPADPDDKDGADTKSGKKKRAKSGVLPNAGGPALGLALLAAPLMGAGFALRRRRD